MTNFDNIPIEQSNNARNKKLKVKKGIATNFANDEYIVKKKWYEELPDDPTDFPKVSQDTWIALKDEAKKCNDSEGVAYNIKCSKTNSEYKWMKTAMARGTVSDKIAAFIILIQDEPVCNLSTIHNIISMIKVGKKKECIVAIDTLTDLMLSDLLRPNVKLKAFYDRPHSKLEELTSGNASLRRKILSYWYFEDQLKEYYTAFVQAINTVAHDTVEANKEKAIAAMYKLLVGNPEQEKNLLSNIVNKLGDPSQKVASKSIYCLGQVIYEHPNMKQVVLNEIERLLFRPNVSTRTQYYGICFLTQFILTVEDYEVAKNLIAVYFAFFKACVKKEQVDSRMMSALLTGVNRAYPFAKTELTKIQEHIDTMYKVVHVASFNVSIHALNLLYHISSHNDTVKDRFYIALYKKLQDPEIGSTKHQALFLNLVFRALKKDTKVHRVKAFIKRLLEVALYMQPSMACGILFLIQQLMQGKKHLLALENMKDENSTEPMISLNAVIKDVVNDIIEETTEETKVKQASKTTKTSKPNVEVNGIQINAAVIEKRKEPEKEENDILEESVVEEETDDLLPGNVKIKSEFNHQKITTYNPLNRNPLYAGGEFCVYIELLNLQKHFHPTVALYASKILNAENIIYSGDPLKDFTLSRFLERFSFKNPKSAGEVEKKGVNPIFGKRKLEVATGIRSLAVNSKSYLSHDNKKIPVEERFMYTYLLQKQQEQEKVKEEEDEDDSDVDSVGDDEFEEMLRKMSGTAKMEEELDFMTDVGESLKKTKKSKKRDEESDSDDEGDEEDDDDDNGDEEELDFSGDDDFGDEDLDEVDDKEDFGGDADDDDLDFDDDDDNDVRIESDSDEDKGKKAVKNKKLMKKGKNKDDIGSLFASADEFASILDEDADYMAGTSQAVSNKDNAHLKQIAWEQNRDRWIKGYNKALGKGGKNFNKNKSNKEVSNKSKKHFSKKRSKSQQGGNKNKKQKKH